ncbi:hypothetical protein LEP1GSC170_5945 [Leptospira interrogans serovar Bataviae str. HAI135]|nr:hypothetical protein LEP1GSC170_5945 [Leptospira interrogans serovar Bataviae str. HAI135]
MAINKTVSIDRFHEQKENSFLNNSMIEVLSDWICFFIRVFEKFHSSDQQNCFNRPFL